MLRDKGVSRINVFKHKEGRLSALGEYLFVRSNREAGLSSHANDFFDIQMIIVDKTRPRFQNLAVDSLPEESEGRKAGFCAHSKERWDRLQSENAEYPPKLQSYLFARHVPPDMNKTALRTRFSALLADVPIMSIILRASICYLRLTTPEYVGELMKSLRNTSAHELELEPELLEG
ncbi:hypothetical protein V8E53_004832 [Lactarius tabidus]